MPRRCSVKGCRSNYDGENECTTTFSLPKDSALRERWLRNIPNDFTSIKNPYVCIKHFGEDAVIRVSKVEYKGEDKEIHRKRPKLKDNAVPTIFPQNVPKFLSTPTSSVRRPVNVEEENSAMKTRLEDHRDGKIQRYLEKDKINNTDEILCCIQDKKPLSESIMQWICMKNGVESMESSMQIKVQKDDRNTGLNGSNKRNAENEVFIEAKKAKVDNSVLPYTNGLSYSCSFDLQAAIISILDSTDIQTHAAQQMKELSKKITELENNYKELDTLFEKISKDSEKLRIVNYIPRDEIEIVDYVFRDNKGELRISSPQKILLARPRSKTGNNVSLLRKNTLPVVNRVHIPEYSRTVQNRDYSRHGDAEKHADVIPVGKFQTTRPNLPPVGSLKRKEIHIAMRVFAVKMTYLGIWLKGRVMDVRTTSLGEKLYKVKFDSKKSAGPRLYTGKHLAYTEPPDVIVPVGTRVVAYYRDEYTNNQSSVYAGVVAEPPKLMNNYRYLIFFDDGYAQYVKHEELFLVCESSDEVWEDIHPDSKDFIKKYLQQYPERPMLKLQKGQVVKTEWNGVWWVGRVLDVDASLVKMFFDADERTEWIYRGSTRLGPLYNELASAEASRLSGKSRRHNPITKRKNLPYVEYTRGLDDPPPAVQRNNNNNNNDNNNSNNNNSSSINNSSSNSNNSNNDNNDNTNNDSNNEEQNNDDAAGSEDSRPQIAKKHTGVTNGSAHRNVAKKSTTQDRREYIPPDSRGIVYESQSGNWNVKRISNRRRITFRPHACSPKCLERKDDDPSRFRGENPLRIPMLCGWERQILKYRAISKKILFYTAPCGRRLRNPDEIDRYLKQTNSKLTVDLFCFDSYVHPFSEFVPSRILSSIKDITYGKETVPVSCINSLDREYPPYVEYSNQRYPAPGVSLNLDEEFLCGCDCEDNCQDREKCQCQQLTIAATENLPTGRIQDAGYKHRRLYEPLVTGVYECNSRCKCKSNCPNRVVQNGLQLRLQVFKTENKGWGIRAIDDIPQGMFICIYAGQLLTEQLANEDGNQYGDEYLAELDHIEVVERLKEGYESDINPDIEEPKVPEKKEEEEEEEEEEEDTEDSGDETDDEGSSNPLKGTYTDDSDFEFTMSEPLGAKEHLTRSKTGNKQPEDAVNDVGGADDQLHDRSTPKKEDAVKNSVDKTTEWLKTVEASIRAEDSDSTPPSCPSQATADTKPNQDEKLTASNQAESPTECKPNESKCGLKPRSLSPNTLNELNKVTLKRKVRIESRESKSDKESVSDSEESSKLEKSLQDPSEADSNDVCSVKKSLFSQLPDPTQHPNLVRGERQRQSIRSYFNEEYCYIMDAKTRGNIGRYLNHSCSPNVFVQNVFVDTHDLRFPWVTFFAMTYIRAGTELTWDYNYEVGSVPGRALYCNCGSSECRGRLL